MVEPFSVPEDGITREVVAPLQARDPLNELGDPRKDQEAVDELVAQPERVDVPVRVHLPDFVIASRLVPPIPLSHTRSFMSWSCQPS